MIIYSVRWSTNILDSLLLKIEFSNKANCHNNNNNNNNNNVNIHGINLMDTMFDSTNQGSRIHFPKPSSKFA